MKHLSLFMLYLRGSVYKLAFISFLMSGVQLYMFKTRMDRTVEIFSAGVGLFPSLETVVGSSKITPIFAIAFLLLAFFLCRFGCGKGSRQEYLYNRLRVSENTAFLWQSAANALILAVFCAVELVTLFAVSCIYNSSVPSEIMTSQTAFLAFVREPFLHSVLPIEDPVKIVRNIVLIMSLGVSYASFPYLSRRGKLAPFAIVMTLSPLIWFRAESFIYSAADVILLMISVTAMGFTLKNVFFSGKEEDCE